MKIYKLKLGPLRTNTYILEKKNKCLIIDCPSDNKDDIKKINSIIKDKELIEIIYTHNHFDHISGGHKFNVSQFMHKKDIESLNKQINFGKIFNFPIKKLPNIQSIEKVPLELQGLFNFKIIETPGHTKGGISILFEKEKVIFTGDTLFKETHGRTDLEFGDEIEMKESLKTLLKLDKDIVIYPGHGDNSTIKEEIENLSKYIL